MPSSTKADWLIPAALIALSLLPALGGATRLTELATGAAPTPDHARFIAAPWLVSLHIVSSVVFCVLGAFQFAPAFRHRRPDWHRAAGRVLVACGLVSALTALWLNHLRPPASFTGPLPASFDGPDLYFIRLLAGTAMAGSLVLGVTAILRRDVPRHRAWMIRAYALGLAAGTQAFTHLPWFLFPDLRGELARTLCMAAGWVLNLAFAEWVIARERPKPYPTPACPPDRAPRRIRCDRSASRSVSR